MSVISVITPVYRAEKFLGACVESVRRQTFEDWELLLIDDGSPDGSGALCDQFAKQDDRIRAFHKENGGVSSARNVGLEQATGTYIAFLDSDDCFAPEMLETLLGLIHRNQADSAACAHRNVASLEDDGQSELFCKEGVYDSAAIRETIVLPLLGERLRQPVFNGFIWRCLYSAEILRRIGLSFEGAYLEDELFLTEYFCNAERLAVTERPLYRYLNNTASATHKYMADFGQVFSRFMERKEALAKRYGLEELCPLWRENSNWAGILIAVGNEFAEGNPRTAGEKRRAIENWCARPEMAQAISTLKPRGLSRRKQIVADLICGRHFFLLSELYQMKNR